jgi:UMF1 family MFS transporter
LLKRWLPLIVRNHWDVLALKSPSAGELYATTNRVTEGIQSRAVSLMFVAVIVYLLLSAGMFIGLGPELGDDVTVRIVCLVCAAWMSLLVTWTVSGMPMRPGPPVPRGQNIVTASARRMLSALPRVWRSPQATIFLGSYFIWSDGVSTLSGAAAVFASQELELGFDALIIAYLCTAVASLLSSILFPWLAQRYGIAGKRILMANLLVMGLIPIYAIFALTSEPEFYGVTFLFGLMNGSAQVFAVSLYSSNIVMRGRGSEFFALWQIAAQGSAWIGPLLLSVVSTNTGSYRTAFACLAALLIGGMAVLGFFDPERAAQQRNSAEHDDLEMRELTAALAKQPPHEHGEPANNSAGRL